MSSTFENQTLGDIVAGNYQAAEIFERYGLDFCCGGRTSLEKACRLHEADLPAILAELQGLKAVTEPPLSHDPVALVTHIVSQHHAYVRRAIPSIQTHLAKVIGAHGARHPELSAVAANFNHVADDLMRHLVKEEQVLFPYIRAIAESVERGEAPPPDVFGTVQNPIRMLETEHQEAGDELAMIRTSTANYEPPEDACTTYRLVYAELREFERDLHRHVHLENNVLFPRAIALEAQVSRKLHCEAPEGARGVEK